MLKKKMNFISVFITQKQNMKAISTRVYTLKRKLGSGTYGTVHSVVRDDETKFAYKAFHCRTLDVGILREISVLKLFHGNTTGLMGLEDIIERTSRIRGIIIPLYKRDLFDAIYESDDLTVEEQWKIVSQLLMAIYTMHENGVIHRDIKPENIMLDKDHNAVLIDFTFAKVFTGLHREETHTGHLGTRAYKAPEVIKSGSHDFASDIWALGLVFYELLVEQTSEDRQLFASFNNSRVVHTFVADRLKSLEDDKCGKLLRAMLNPDPSQRLTAKKLIKRFFGKVPKISMIWKSPTRGGRISKEIKGLCEDFGVEKKITRRAAQKYVKCTGCKPYLAVELAAKFYEPDYTEDENVHDSEHLEIFRKMDYNLFV